MSVRTQPLVAQDRALWDYLDALLQELPEPAAAPEAVAVEVAGAPLGRPAVAKPVIAEAVAVEPAQPAPIEPAVAAEEPAGPPDWAQANFQALLFTVSGLTLAVPLVKLNSVLPWPSEGVAAMPAQPAWCHGLLRYREQNVRVVDTATLVIPEDRRAVLQPSPPRHILVIGDGRWGLACSAIGDVIRLRPNEVKWRSRDGRRPWLAGTVLGHLCALMDTEAFARLLAERRG